MDKLGNLNDCCEVQVFRSRSVNESLNFNGWYKLEHVRDGEVIYTEEGPNSVMNEGKKHLLDVVFAGSTAKTTWYVALVANTTPPDPATLTWAYDTFFQTQATEVTAYSSATRPEFVETVAAGPPSKVSNPVPNRAAFTFNNSAAVYGAVLVSNSTKNDHTNGDILMSYRAFTSVINVISGDVINVEIELSW